LNVLTNILRIQFDYYNILPVAVVLGKKDIQFELFSHENPVAFLFSQDLTTIFSQHVNCYIRQEKTNHPYPTQIMTTLVM
jgi:hypothetical protein